MDTYQAVYDATRSRISNGDVGNAVERVARDALDTSYVKALAQQEISAVSYEWQRPSVLFRPSLSADGSMWCALLGDNLQEGVAGFGETPAAAMAAFDQAFREERTPTRIRLAQGMAARSGETGTGSTEGNSPVAESDAQ